MRDWERIIIHHSATVDSGTLSWDDIIRYHIDNKKWSDVGYHYGAEMIDGKPVVMVGRPLNRKGAHCKENDMNSRAIGICFIGDYDTQEPPEILLREVAKRLIKPLIIYHDIPMTNIEPHRKYAPKSCPGSKFSMGDFKEIIRQELE